MLAGAWDSWQGNARQAYGSLQLLVLLSSCNRTLVRAGRTLAAKCGTRFATEPAVDSLQPCFAASRVGTWQC